MDAAAIKPASSEDRIGITDVSPVVDCGRFPARCIDGEVVSFTATVFREGHDALGVTAVLSKDGIDEIFATCAAEGMMLHESGLVPWSVAGGKKDLTGYSEFLGPRG